MMSRISFTLIEMITSLEAIGYTVQKDTIMLPDRYDEDKPYKVWNVYLDGHLMCEWGGAGSFRVEYMFERELTKRLLELFKPPDC
jgi:hypothetical protein